MKILLVTGRLAEGLVKESAQSFARDADVLVLDTNVAAFITPEMLLRADPKGYDLILVPGAVTADFSRAEEILGSRIRLGPKHAADLGFALKHLGDVELSRTIPACVLMEKSMARNALSRIDAIEARAEPALTIRGIKVGGGSRMKVLAEVVDAPRLSPERLAEKVRYFQDQGADMVDLGLPPDCTPQDVVKAVKTARGATDLPLSIDTVLPELILAGLTAGADMVLSLNGKNISLVGKALASCGVPAVVIPGPGSLEDNLAAAEALGIKVIADPILNPPLQGMTVSMEGYTELRRRRPQTPLFFGVGNVTELIDADSAGANALLAAVGAEVSASILFTPEYSEKARGSVRELKIASEMMLLAKERRTPPKDLGLDLLVLKEKRRKAPPTSLKPQRTQEASCDHAWHEDPAGNFEILLGGGRILVRGCGAQLEGISARDILNTLIDLGMVTRLDHVGYLGRELEKAEIALALGRSYVQDEPLFPGKVLK